MNKRGAFTCVVDDDPRFHLEASRWFIALTDVAGVDPSDLVVHVVDGCSSDVIDHLRNAGVTVRSVEPFDERVPLTNKIAGALSLARTGVEGLAVLTDTDVMVLEDPRRLPIPQGSVASKVVDLQNPPIPTLEQAFSAAGLEIPPLVPLDWHSTQRTVAGNTNGGMYLIPGDFLATIADAWAEWTRWMLERVDDFPPRGLFVDQMGMVLAIAATGTEPWRLDPRWNFPTHLPEAIPADTPSPSVVHYHRRVSKDGLLEPTGVPAVDAQIDRANEAITQAWNAAFPRESFQAWREAVG